MIQMWLPSSRLQTATFYKQVVTLDVINEIISPFCVCVCVCKDRQDHCTFSFRAAEYADGSLPRWRSTLEIHTPPRGILKMNKTIENMGTKTDRQRYSETYRETEGVRMMRTAADLWCGPRRGSAWRGRGRPAEGRGFPLLLALWSHPQSFCFLRGLQKHTLLVWNDLSLLRSARLQSSGSAKAKLAGKKHKLVHVDPVWAGSPEVLVCFCNNK